MNVQGWCAEVRWSSELSSASGAAQKDCARWTSLYQQLGAGRRPNPGLSSSQAFPDNAARREVESLPAVCPNNGCTWKGTLKEYEVKTGIPILLGAALGGPPVVWWLEPGS